MVKLSELTGLPLLKVKLKSINIHKDTWMHTGKVVRICVQWDNFQNVDTTKYFNTYKL